MEPRFTVSEFIDVVNQTLDYAYASTLVEGEVSELKTSQGKWVFFNLKDETSSLPCFIPLFKLRIPLEDGMKVVLRGHPKLTAWGKFSFTIEQIMPVGEGSIKKAFEMLKKKLEKEGLFSPERKRPLPENLVNIGVISSTGAAGYADFCKIVNARWGGLKIQTAHTQVQGLDAPAQIIRALRYFNEKSEVQLIVIIRGGGSKDDLACFNDEGLAREIAASKIPVMTGIGHEVDESLAALAADLRGSTPSNVAELITPDKRIVRTKVKSCVDNARARIEITASSTYDTMIKLYQDAKTQIWRRLSDEDDKVTERVGRLNRIILRNLDEFSRRDAIEKISQRIHEQVALASERILARQKMIERLNPELVLKQGYSIISGKLAPGSMVEITTDKNIASAEIKAIKERK